MTTSGRIGLSSSCSPSSGPAERPLKQKNRSIIVFEKRDLLFPILQNKPRYLPVASWCVNGRSNTLSMTSIQSSLSDSV